MACRCIYKIYDDVQKDLEDKGFEVTMRPQMHMINFDCGGVAPGLVGLLHYKYRSEKGREKKGEYNYPFTHCPVCGKKYKEDEIKPEGAK